MRCAVPPPWLPEATSRWRPSGTGRRRLTCTGSRDLSQPPPRTRLAPRTPGLERRVRVPDESAHVYVRATRPPLTSYVRAQRISQYIQARQQKRRVAPVELISARPRAYNDGRETRATFPRLLRGERLAGQPARLLPLPSDAGQRGGNEEHGLHGVLLLALRLRYAGRTRRPL